MISVEGYNSTELEQIAYELWAPNRGRLTPFMLGLIFDGLLQGIIFCQFATWWDRSMRSDSNVNRALAFWMMLVGLTFTAVQGARVMTYFCYDFGDYTNFLEQRWGMAAILLLLLALVPVQAFYINRAYILSNRSRPLLLFLSGLWMTTVATGIAALYYFPAVALEWTPCEISLFTSLSAVAAATDISITAAIVVCLWRRRTGEYSGDRLVSRLVRLSAETQLPPSIFAILFAALDASGHLWLSPALVPLMLKSCVMALFKVLNSRRKLREEFLPRTLPPRTSPQDLASSLFMQHPSRAELEFIHTPDTPPSQATFSPALLDAHGAGALDALDARDGEAKSSRSVTPA